MTITRNKELQDRFDVLIQDGGWLAAVVKKIAGEFDLKEARVKEILKENCVDFAAIRREEMKDRDALIVAAYMAGEEQAEIAEEFGMTPTRIGQIIREALGRNAKHALLEQDLVKIKKDVRAGMQHKELQDKYGASTLRKVKSNLGYNVFEKCLDRRNKGILEMYENGKSAAYIAEEYGLTRDHIYGILHGFGVRSKPTEEEYAERNAEIVDKFQGGKSSQDLADEYDMTVTNINIILKNNDARE